MNEGKRTPPVHLPSFFSAGLINRIPIHHLVLIFLGFNLVQIPPTPSSVANNPPRQYSYQVVHEFPHDQGAFTQGLAYDQGIVYEGTGLYGKSSLRKVDLNTGRVELMHEHEAQIFAEGIAVVEDKIYQLTWQNNLIFEFKKDDFSLQRKWPFAREGWGMTNDGEHLIVSDGSASLYFLDPATMEELHSIKVHDHTGPVMRLNELEYVKGRIFANIYQQDRIAMIAPEDGTVSGYLDLNGLSTRLKKDNRAGVLNGIMYDPVNDRLFVTGKLWTSLFEIKLVP